MSGTVRIVAGTLLLAVAATGLALAKTPVPGSEGDPIVTKSYVDQHAVWSPRGVELNSFCKLAPGCELVVADAGGADTLPLKEANLADCVLLDLTAGARLQEMGLAVGHHYLVAPGTEARLTFAGRGTVLTRGLVP